MKSLLRKSVGRCLLGAVVLFGSDGSHAATAHLTTQACARVGDSTHVCPPTGDVLSNLTASSSASIATRDSSQWTTQDVASRSGSASAEGWEDSGHRTWGYRTQARLQEQDSSNHPVVYATFESVLTDTINFGTERPGQMLSVTLAAPVISGHTSGFCFAADTRQGDCADSAFWYSEFIVQVRLDRQTWVLYRDTHQVGLNSIIETNYESGSRTFQILSGQPHAFEITTVGLSRADTSNCFVCGQHPERTYETEGDFYDTIAWNGFSRVLDQSGQPISYNFTAGSGINWSAAAPVSEAPVWLALTSGLSALIWQRKTQSAKR